MHEIEAATPNIGARVEWWRKRKGISRRKFAQMLGKDRSYLYGLESGKKQKSVTEPTLRLLAQALGITVGQFLGPLPGSVAQAEEEARRSTLDGVADDLERLRDRLCRMELAPVPVLGVIPAGYAEFQEQRLLGYENVPLSDVNRYGEVYVLKIKGDSLTGDGILEGDRVLIARHADFVEGAICVVRTEDLVTLKHVYRRAGKLILRASNPAYQDTEVSAADIQGQAIRVIRELPPR